MISYQLKLCIVEPDIFFVLITGCLEPGVTVKMAYHPAGIHLESGCYRLRMKRSSRNCGKAVINALENLAHRDISETITWAQGKEKHGDSLSYYIDELNKDILEFSK